MTWHNDDNWQKSSDEWVKAVEESRKRKEAKRNAICDHDDFGWCEICLTTVDGEKLTPV